MFSFVKSQNIFCYIALIYLHLTWHLLATPQFGGQQQLPQQQGQQNPPDPLGGSKGAPKGIGGPKSRSEKSDDDGPLKQPQGSPQFGQYNQSQGLPKNSGPNRKEKKESNENETVHFFLWDKKGATLDERLVLINENGSLPRHWRYGGEIKVIAHGYHADYSLTPLEHLEDHKIPIIAEEYAKVNKTLNVIIVEWSGLAIRAAYPESAENTKPVGKLTAEFLLRMHNRGAFKDFNKIHIIGFSLGSHLAGVAGYQVQELSNHKHKLGRITGLDPAGPLFDMDGGHMPNDTTGFLEKSDAHFVDIIHCNMGTQHWSRALPEGKLGSHVQAGHVDFYPNGGYSQFHQCTEDLDKMIACSHRCCVFFYAFSLTRPEMGCPCKTWDDYSKNYCLCDEKTKGAYLGDPCTRKARGKYFIEMKEDLNMTNIIPKEMPNIKADKQAEQVANRFEKAQVDGQSPDGLARMGQSANPNPSGNMSMPDGKGPGLPPPQSGGGLPPPHSGGGLPPPQSGGGLPPPQSGGPGFNQTGSPQLGGGPQLGGNHTGPPQLGGPQDGSNRMGGGPGLNGSSMDAPKMDAPKLDGPKMDGANLNGTKMDGPKMDAPKLDAPKMDGPGMNGSSMDAPKMDAPKLDGPKMDGANLNGSKVDGPKMDAPKLDGPKMDGKYNGSKMEHPKVDHPKMDPPKVDMPKDFGKLPGSGEKDSTEAGRDKKKRRKDGGTPPTASTPMSFEEHRKKIEYRLKHMFDVNKTKR